MYNIIVDTREKVGKWDFTIADTISKKLDTGDYSIEGLEDVLCIERKKSVSELAKNINESRFERWLERMSKFKYKFLILEFDYFKVDQYPEGSGLPRDVIEKIKIRGHFITSVLIRIQMQYGIQVVFAGNMTYAQYIAENIIKKVAKEYGKA